MAIEQTALVSNLQLSAYKNIYKGILGLEKKKDRLIKKVTPILDEIDEVDSQITSIYHILEQGLGNNYRELLGIIPICSENTGDNLEENSIVPMVQTFPESQPYNEEA